MWREVPDSVDRFPGDFMASLRSGVLAAAMLGALSWWLARVYLLRTYPGHAEMLSAAIVVGVMDGAMFGVGAFVVTYVVRVWRYERQMRRRSDEALRRELAEIAGSAEPDTDSRRPS